jgi:4-hydroxymandelate oxidase
MSAKLTRREAIISTLSAAAAASALPWVGAIAKTPTQALPSDARRRVTRFSGSVHPVSVPDYESLAHERMSHVAWEYISSGSADEVTLRWNREALTRVRLRPHVLTDVSHIDTSIRLFGREMPHPILLAPTSTQMLANKEGEVATVRGAGAADATMVISTLSNRSVEEISHAATQPVWFQLYVEDDRGITKELVQRAESAGCQALCITVDLPIVYARDREARIADPPQFPFPNLNITAGPGGRGRKGGGSLKFGWKDLEWIQSFAKTPILLKGILDPEEADHAVKAGAAGIVVSNHGGRALDSVPATIDALPLVVDKVAGRIPVLVDGGIRRGTDVLKGLANGASAVLVGRPYLYGLAVGGSDGVRDVIQILRGELEAAMALTGRTSIGAIDRGVLWSA